MKSQIILSNVWPCFIVFIIVFNLFARALVARKTYFKSNFQKLWNTVLYVTIILFYLSLPSVSNSILRARKCQAFVTNDSKELSKSYLIEDWRIECGYENDEYHSLSKIFSIFKHSCLSLCLWYFLAYFGTSVIQSNPSTQQPFPKYAGFFGGARRKLWFCGISLILCLKFSSQVSLFLWILRKVRVESYAWYLQQLYQVCICESFHTPVPTKVHVTFN